jgi:molybdate transport system substrate-binding protein
MNAFWKIACLGSILSLLLAGCSSIDRQATVTSKKSAQVPEQTELLVSAAASLQDSLKEFAELYTKIHPEIKLTFNFGASGALQQQIEQGAPTDLFISAGNKQMDALVSKQLMGQDKPVHLLSNSLVVIVPSDSKLHVTAMPDLNSPAVNKIAIGDVETVPAGSYAKEAISYFKLWDGLQPKLVFAKDVRQVLTYVESGNVDAGFVYRTDALTSQKVKVAFTAEAVSHKAIEYPAAVVKASKHTAEAAQLLSDLHKQNAADIFNKYGFTQPVK